MNEKSRLSRSDIMLIVFGVLDGIALCRTVPILFRTIYGFSTYGLPSWGPMVVVDILSILLFSSYAVSGFAFLSRKRWAFLLYYCQFPLRLLFFSMSLGFLFLINKPFGSIPVHYTIAGIVSLAELARLVVTIVIHRRSNKNFQATRHSTRVMASA